MEDFSIESNSPWADLANGYTIARHSFTQIRYIDGQNTGVWKRDIGAAGAKS